jgi:hypothetical protein
MNDKNLINNKIDGKSHIEITKVSSTTQQLKSFSINNVNNNNNNNNEQAPGTSKSSIQNGSIQPKIFIKLLDSSIVPLPTSSHKNFTNNISNTFSPINKQIIMNSFSFEQKKNLMRMQNTSKINLKLLDNQKEAPKESLNVYSLKEYKTGQLNSFMAKLPKINSTNELNYLYREYIINGKVTYLLEDMKKNDKIDSRMNIYEFFVENLYDICKKSKQACEKLDLKFKRSSFLLENIKNHSISDLLDLDHEHNKFLAFSIMKLLEITEKTCVPIRENVNKKNHQRPKTSSISDQLSNPTLNKNIEQVINEINRGKDLIPDDFERLINDDIIDFNNNHNDINNSNAPCEQNKSFSESPHINNLTSLVSTQNERTTHISQSELTKNIATPKHNNSIQSEIQIDESDPIQISRDPRFKHYLTKLIELILIISNKLNGLSWLQINYLMKESCNFYCVSNSSDSMNGALCNDDNKLRSYNSMLFLRKNKLKSCLFEPSPDESNNFNLDLFKEIYSYLEEKILINLYKVDLKKCVTSSSTFDYFTDIIDLYYIIKREYDSFKTKINNSKDSDNHLFDNLNDFKCLNHDLLHDLLLNLSGSNYGFDEYFSVAFRPIPIEQLSKFQYDDSGKSSKDPRLINYNLNNVNKCDLKEIKYTIENEINVLRNQSEINSNHEYKLYVKNKYKKRFELKEIKFSSFNSSYSPLEKIDIIENMADISIASDQILNNSYSSSNNNLNRNLNESTFIPTTPSFHQNKNANDSLLLKEFETPVKSNINSSFASVPPTPGGDFFSYNDENNNNIKKKKKEFEIYDSTPILNHSINSNSSLDNAICLDNLLNIKSFFEEEKSSNVNNHISSKDLNNIHTENGAKENNQTNEKNLVSRSNQEKDNLESSRLDPKLSTTETEQKLPRILSAYKLFSENLNKEKHGENENSLSLKDTGDNDKLTKLYSSPSTYNYTSSLASHRSLDSIISNKSKILTILNEDQLMNIPNNRSPVIDIDYNQINEVSSDKKRNSSTISSNCSLALSKRQKISSYSNENTLDNVDMSDKFKNTHKNDDRYRGDRCRSRSRTRQESRATRSSNRNRSTSRNRKRSRSRSRSSNRHRRKLRGNNRSRSQCRRYDFDDDKSRNRDEISNKDNTSNDSVYKIVESTSNSKTSSNEKVIKTNNDGNQQVQLYQYQFSDKLQLNKYEFNRNYIVTYPTDSSTSNSTNGPDKN